MSFLFHLLELGFEKTALTQKLPSNVCNIFELSRKPPNMNDVNKQVRVKQKFIFPHLKFLGFMLFGHNLLSYMFFQIVFFPKFL